MTTSFDNILLPTQMALFASWLACIARLVTSNEIASRLKL